jgi:DNA helicase-2/ATP-dependent DNA helicase PcrA
MSLFEPRGMRPTPQQREIQTATAPRIIVQANAGAAKTTSLVLRLGQALVDGVSPGRIQVLTYTEAAVQAFHATLTRMGVDTPTRRALRVQTFEQFCAQRLKAVEGQGVRQLHTAEALKPHVLRALRRVLDNPDDRYRDDFTLADADEGNVEGLLSTFARLKGRLALQTELGERSLNPDVADEMGCDYISLRALNRYEHERRGGHPDHPAYRGPQDATYDLARWLLEPDNAPLAEGLLPCLELGLQLLLVDEMHDCNRAMFTVLGQVLGRNPGCAFVGVGDRDQVIHGEAGADAAFMGPAFDSEIGPATHLPLSASYRFGPQLAQAVSRLADKPCEARSPHDTDVRVYGVSAQHSASHEARQVLALLGDLQGLPSGTAPGELAVLLRQPHQSVALECMMLNKGLAYRTAGFAPFLMRPEILCVRGLMAHAHGTFDQIEPVATREAVLQALVMVAGALVNDGREAPASNERDEPTDVGDDLDDVLAEALDSGEDWLDEDPDAPPTPARDEQAWQLARVRATEAAIRQVAANPQLAADFIDNQVLRNAHPTALVRLQGALNVLRGAPGPGARTWAADFMAALDAPTLARRVRVHAQDVMQFHANIEALVQVSVAFDDARALARALNSWTLRLGAMRPADCVLLSSIEAAKGLEFAHVIIPGLNRGDFMVGHSVSDTRNLLYVGMTRARHRLSLLAREDRPSPFLRDAGLI